MALPTSSAKTNSLIDGLDELNPKTSDGAAAKIAAKVMKKNKEQFSEKVLVSLTPSLKAELEDYAIEQGMTNSEVIRRALRQYIAK